MASKYYFRWSCSKCDYNEMSISGPLRIEPQEGIPKAKIEFRWCNECNGIRRCFTGIGHSFKPGDEPNSKAQKYSSIEKIQVEISKLTFKINEMETKRGKIFFFFFPRKSKELAKLKEKLIKTETDLFKYHESMKICNKLTEQSHKYYEDLKPAPKCLTCGSANISTVEWNVDQHYCGGNFVKEDLGRLGIVSEYKRIRYDQNGDSVHSIVQM